MIIKLAISFALLPSFAFGGEVISESMVLDSSLKNFPNILNARELLKSYAYGVKENEGLFDAKLEAKMDSDVSGHYDGRIADARIVKRLKQLNAKIYAGYRVSDGLFPIYEGKKETLSNGEYLGGIEFSLFQDRAIDQRRLQLRLAKLDYEAGKLELMDQKLNVLMEASVAYWNWVIAGWKLEVYKAMLELSVKRNEGIKKRIRKGDLARIYLTESRQYIVKRRSLLLKSEAKFNKAALILSLYYRDDKAGPIILSKESLPKFDYSVYKVISPDQFNIKEEVIKRAPKLSQLSLKEKAYEQKIEFGENKLLPKLNLAFEYSKDSGAGSRTLAEQETQALIKLEIPIERNLGKGKIGKNRALKRSIFYKKEMVENKLTASYKDLRQKLEIDLNVIKYSNEEIGLARKLQIAERKKFYNGASDFFVLNLREGNLIEAQVNQLDAIWDFHLSKAKFEKISLAHFKKVK